MRLCDTPRVDDGQVGPGDEVVEIGDHEGGLVCHVVERMGEGGVEAGFELGETAGEVD